MHNAKEVQAFGAQLRKLAQTASLDECLFTAAGFLLLLSEQHKKTPEELHRLLGFKIPFAQIELAATKTDILKKK